MAGTAIPRSDTLTAVQSAPLVPASFRVTRRDSNEPLNARAASVTVEPAIAPTAQRFGAAGPTNRRTNEPTNQRTHEPVHVCLPGTLRRLQPPDVRSPSSDEPVPGMQPRLRASKSQTCAKKTSVGIASVFSRAERIAGAKLLMCVSRLRSPSSSRRRRGAWRTTIEHRVCGSRRGPGPRSADRPRAHLPDGREDSPADALGGARRRGIGRHQVARRGRTTKAIELLIGSDPQARAGPAEQMGISRRSDARRRVVGRRPDLAGE